MRAATANCCAGAVGHMVEQSCRLPGAGKSADFACERHHDGIGAGPRSGPGLPFPNFGAHSRRCCGLRCFGDRRDIVNLRAPTTIRCRSRWPCEPTRGDVQHQSHWSKTYRKRARALRLFMGNEKTHGESVRGTCSMHGGVQLPFAEAPPSTRAKRDAGPVSGWRLDSIRGSVGAAILDRRGKL